MSLPTAGALIVVMLQATATPTSALAACRAALQGELVQAPGPRQAFPQKYLFFSLHEIEQGNRPVFQSFTIPNTRTTLPIPFTLNIDSKKDCPRELELSVSTSDFDPPGFRLSDEPLRGSKRVRLETITVWGPYF
jgi:hypothetical protein